MRAHTQFFKEQIKELGKEIDSKITYGDNTILAEQLFNIKPIINGTILKSAMKELHFESSIKVPQYNVLKYEFGLKVNGEYEYIDYGNYIVKSVEYNEDTKTYKHTCYDSMLFSMKEYITLQNGTFPMTVREYLTNLCLDCGLVFKNTNDTFANYDKVIESDLYSDLGYTYRDVFDELSQVTASTICVDSNDMIEIRYINDTADTIDAEYLKDVNVIFKEKYGPINSIVLSRSAESDNVYLRDEESIESNGLCELKIMDNQIMNDNNRSDYLPDILSKLNGLEYYLNDYTSTGILYYELCDKYTVQIEENIYSCILFNDEPEITQGLAEQIFTDKPVGSLTDYKKADINDKKIKLIVDKQNKKIEALSEETTENSNRLAKAELNIENISNSVSYVANLIREKNSLNVLELDSCVEGNLLSLKIKGFVEYIYPSQSLFPSSTLFPKSSNLIVEYEDGTLNKIKLPIPHLWVFENIYDEFVIESEKTYLIKRVEKDEDGSYYLLDSEEKIEYDSIEIKLQNRTNKIYLESFQNGIQLFGKYAIKNEFSDVFATNYSVNAGINIAKNEVLIQAEEKIDNETSSDKLVAKINVKPGRILLEGTITANGNFKVLEDGSIEANNGTFSGNIYLNNGNKVIGGDGLFTNLQFQCNYGESDLGWYYLESFKKHGLQIIYSIPENFTIESAYLIFTHIPCDNSYTNETGETNIYRGYARNVKLYKVSSMNNLTYQRRGFNGDPDYSSLSKNNISEAFGSDGYTPNSSSTVMIKTSDFASHLSKGETGMLLIDTSDSLVSSIQEALERTGRASAILIVTGYMKF